jgi:hypothetical protein
MRKTIIEGEAINGAYDGIQLTETKNFSKEGIECPQEQIGAIRGSSQSQQHWTATSTGSDNNPKSWEPRELSK